MPEQQSGSGKRTDSGSDSGADSNSESGAVASFNSGSGTCICFDYGSKRIGVAVGQTQLRTARPLAVVNNHNGTPDWPAIDQLIDQWQPEYLVVGWPLSEDGLEQSLTAHVRGFIKRLEQRYSRRVHKADERYSSIAAQEQIRQQRHSGQRKRRTRRGDVDTVAAALILESWFSLRTTP